MERDFIIKSIKNIVNNIFSHEHGYQFEINEITWVSEYTNETWMWATMTTYNRWGEGDINKGNEVRIYISDDGKFHIEGDNTVFDYWGIVNEDGSISEQ